MTAHLMWRGTVELVVDWEEAEVDRDLQAVIDEIWDDAAGAHSTLFDGLVLSVSGVDIGRRIVYVRRCRYRSFFARERDPSLRSRIRVRPIGVSGCVTVADDGVVVGRRSGDVTEYPGAWELVPSGGIPAPSAGSAVDARAAFLTELHEELGVNPSDAHEVRSIGLAHDDSHDTFDICFAATLPAGRLRPHEYSDVVVLPMERARALLGTRPAVPTSRMLLDAG